MFLQLFAPLNVATLQLPKTVFIYKRYNYIILYIYFHPLLSATTFTLRQHFLQSQKGGRKFRMYIIYIVADT